MKLKNLFFCTSAALAFAACNSSEDAIDIARPNWNANGEGYIAFTVSMPADNGTRAANDEYDKGEAWEYAVNNIALMIFKGADEANAVYQQYVDLSDDKDFGNGVEGNVTVDKKYVHKITAMEKGDNEKYYALAILNNNGVFLYNAGALTIAGNNVTAETKFKDIQGWVAQTNLNADELQSKTKGILMLNAPLYSKQGSTVGLSVEGGTLNILQDISGSIFESETQARESDACANIYVERAVAKVSVAGNINGGDGASDPIKWELLNWGVDNTNKSSYIVRNMANFNDVYKFASYKADNIANVPRMIGYKSVAHNAVSYGAPDANDRYRTYFAVDPNYSTPEINGWNNAPTLTLNEFGENVAHFCAENVFDVNNQVWGQTTRVIVKAKLYAKTGETLYAHQGDEKFLLENTVKEMAFNKAIQTLRADLQVYRNNGLLDGSITFDASYITVADDKNEIAVELPRASITVGAGITDADVLSKGIAGIDTRVKLENALAAVTSFSQKLDAAAIGAKYYQNGEAYYQVRIKHFGDDLTPWNNGEFEVGRAPQPNIVSSIYPTNGRRDGNYLGRYGVLRNNWYVVRVGKILKIGYAHLEDLNFKSNPGEPGLDPETPDDVIEKDQWISAEVNILSWAKRFQNNNLGEE